MEDWAEVQRLFHREGLTKKAIARRLGMSRTTTSPFTIELSTAERSALESTSRRYTASYRDVVRARIVLLAASGAENVEIARRLELPVQVVSKWRKRFFEERLAGLAERSRTGRPPAFPPRPRRRGQGDRL